MNIGEPKKNHTNVPGSRPVILPTPKKKEQPIAVPNWPTKKPVQVPVRKPSGS
jgi:hypothetical protein